LGFIALLQKRDFPKTAWILHLKMQPTHSVHVLGGARFAGPRTKPNGVVMPMAAKKKAKKKVAKKKTKKAKKKK
jgi:hypothetical protein